MKMHKFIFTPFLALMAVATMTPQAVSDEPAPKKILFLQDIENKLIHVSGIKYRQVTLLVSTDQKRNIALTPSSISLSYGYLKQMKNINQLVATMAHMTAHISLDYVAPPPLPEGHERGAEDTSLEGYIKGAVKHKYPDKTYMPQATGAFHTKGANIIERPRYNNKDYDYSLNKKNIINAEHELEVDKITHKILRHSGFCPSDYSRMINYFYETPQHILGNKHFVLDADGWQRIDDINRRANPKTACEKSQIDQTQKYANSFDQLMVTVMTALKKKD